MSLVTFVIDKEYFVPFNQRELEYLPLLEKKARGDASATVSLTAENGATAEGLSWALNRIKEFIAMESKGDRPKAEASIKETCGTDTSQLGNILVASRMAGYQLGIEGSSRAFRETLKNAQDAAAIRKKFKLPDDLHPSHKESIVKAHKWIS